MPEPLDTDTTVFVQELDEQRKSLQVTPIVLSGDGDCRVGQPVSFAVPPPDEEGATPRVVTASSQDRFYLARTDPRSPDQAVLKRLRAWQADPQVETIALDGLKPISLLATARRCFLGSVGTIHQLDCDADGPAPVALPGDGSETAGAFDALCLAGQRLVGLLDGLEARFARVIDDPLGAAPSVAFSARLPDYHGERIREAVASETKLAVRTTFYHRGTAGQRLLLFDLSSDALRVSAQPMEVRGAGLLKYGHTRLAGRTNSAWQGLGLLEGKVLIGAGERGVLVGDQAMTDDDRVRRGKVDGTCLDLKVSQGRILALVARKKDGRGRIDLSLLGLTDDPKRPVEVLTSHPLPNRPERLAP